MVNINAKKQITGFFVYIIGFSGSGKLSTAVELSNMINALIVNINLSNNPHACSIYDNTFERSQVQKEIQDRIYDIAQVMLKVIEAYPISSKNYIFIDELIKNNDHDIRMYNSIIKLSEKMNTEVLPIVLKCNLPTLQKRIELKMQRENRRLTSASNTAEKFKRKDLFIPPNAIEIENSNISIKEVAEEIVNQMQKFSLVS
ncbi:hypothetical protein [Wolbachia endosymbiont of Folsomia candida]|uniref:hypothetical protein n=1 Tax=Wolbachia endosymbiont of Folsomia candida TaxID=169402 RepID=UPI000B042101|nr:hypothetical protein [Wolbachia endosymbiont of Folsomia candida]APR99195.1 hypothetical protein ASM33_04440 [Wolbachia endosymbiont of Folsomia candida]